MMSALSKMPICQLGLIFCTIVFGYPRPSQAEPPEIARIESRPPTPAAEIAAVFGAWQNEQAGEQEGKNSHDSDKTSSKKQIEEWVEQLGSVQFAQRERATAGLRAAGREALLSLQKAASSHEDLEVRMRAADVALGIAQGETAGRIDAFLTGKDVGLEGWPIAQAILGDGLRVRELYVDLVMRHEEVARSLMGSAADRTDALRSAIVQIQRGMFVEQRVPTEADAIALLLMVNDRDVPVNRVDEGAIFSVLHREASNLLLKDPQLSPPFRQLLGGWMTRSDVSNRQEMLWFAMGCDLFEARALAVDTLANEDDPVTLSMAAQAASRFASDDDIKKLVPLLKDDRPAAEQQFTGGTIVQAQVRDAAMAAIVLLSDKKLSEFGLNDDAFHPRFGFITQELGFPIDDPRARQAAIKQVRNEILGIELEEPKPEQSDEKD